MNSIKKDDVWKFAKNIKVNANVNEWACAVTVGFMCMAFVAIFKAKYDSDIEKTKILVDAQILDQQGMAKLQNVNNHCLM